MTLEEAADGIGRYVIYVPFQGCNPKIHERGVISSVNDKYVFVKYSLGDTAAATDPKDLHFEVDV